MSACPPVWTSPARRSTTCTPPRRGRPRRARPGAAAPQLSIRRSVEYGRLLGRKAGSARNCDHIARHALLPVRLPHEPRLPARRPLGKRATEVDPRMVCPHAGHRDVAPLRGHRGVVDLRQVDHPDRVRAGGEVVQAGHRPAVVARPAAVAPRASVSRTGEHERRARRAEVTLQPRLGRRVAGAETRLHVVGSGDGDARVAPGVGLHRVDHVVGEADAARAPHIDVVVRRDRDRQRRTRPLLARVPGDVGLQVLHHVAVGDVADARTENHALPRLVLAADREHDQIAVSGRVGPRVRRALGAHRRQVAARGAGDVADVAARRDRSGRGLRRRRLLRRDRRRHRRDRRTDDVLARTENVYFVADFSPDSVAENTPGATVMDGPLGSALTM